MKKKQKMKLTEAEGDNETDSAGNGNGPVLSTDAECKLWQRRAARGGEPARSFAEALEPLAALLHLSHQREADFQVDALYDLFETAESAIDSL
jgi:hypothetical protein